MKNLNYLHRWYHFKFFIKVVVQARKLLKSLLLKVQMHNYFIKKSLNCVDATDNTEKVQIKIMKMKENIRVSLK